MAARRSTAASAARALRHDAELVQYFKAAMDDVGFAGGPTRAPRLPLNDAERANLWAALSVLGASVERPDADRPSERGAGCPAEVTPR